MSTNDHPFRVYSPKSIDPMKAIRDARNLRMKSRSNELQRHFADDERYNALRGVAVPNEDGSWTIPGGVLPPAKTLDQAIDKMLNQMRKEGL